MSTAAPKTPEQISRKSAMSRSFSAASASSRAQPTAEIGATEGVETLFTHPHGKIVKFTSNAPTRPSTSSGTWSPGGWQQQQQQQGTLPWATLTEKTMAAGPLEIYRVPGSVSFLHSGSLLHAILPRSNCWCVDGVSKFAMRVLPDTYYRIEVPGDTPEDLVKVEELKITLQKVLFYERTPCPFARTFTVDLPEEGEPKPRRRRRRTEGPAKKWKLDKAYSWKPEGWTPEQGGPSDGSSGSATASDEEGSSGSPEEHTDEVLDQVKELGIHTPPPARRPTVKDRAKGIDMRSVTAPAQLSLQSTPPARLRSSFIADTPATAYSSASPASRQAKQPLSFPSASVDEPSPRLIPNESQPQIATSLSSPQTSQTGNSLPQNLLEPGSAHGHRAFQPIPTDMPPSPPDSNIGFDFIPTSEPSARRALPHEEMSPAEQSIIHKPALTDATSTPVVLHEVSQPIQGPDSLAGSSDQLDSDPFPSNTTQMDVVPTSSAPQAILEDAEGDVAFVTRHLVDVDLLCDNQLESQDVTQSNLDASLPEISHAGDTLLHVNKEDLGEPLMQDGAAVEVDGNPEDVIEQTSDDVPLPSDSIQIPVDSSTDVHLTRVQSTESDPFAAIQARIQARRSIGGATTNLTTVSRQTTRLSATSTASSSSLRSQLSRRSQNKSEQDQVVATALVRKAASAFLGPPVHLVAIMLKIAARFAKGAFPKALLFESPVGMPKRIPGSFDLDDSDIEEEFDSEGELDEDEDDFGVPLRSPIRLASGESVPRLISEGSVKERRAWDDDV
ncbi:putative inheritance of peroxisomes protein [Septoria linicola]|nr:putative inheritance of peroxisomes protein [Septoria linicola]